MNPAEPPFDAPAFDVPTAPEPRNYGGWIVLAVIFALMTGFQLYQYFTRDADKPQDKYADAALQLKLAVEMKHAFKSLPSGDSQNLNQSLENVETMLVDEAQTDLAAARIYAAARSEQGKEVPPTISTLLKSSKEPRDRRLEEIFNASKLDPKRATELEGRLPQKDFITRLAVVSAHEKAGSPSRRDALISKNKVMAKLGLLAVAGLGMCGGLILLILYFILKAQGMLPTLGFPVAHISLADADRLALRCAQLFTMFLAAPLLLSFLPENSVDRHTLTLLLYIGLILGTIYMFRLPVGGKQISLGAIGINRQNLGKNVAWGVGAAFANLPLVLAFALLGQWLFSGLPKAQHPTTVEIQTGISFYGTLVVLFAGSVGAPILEEIMFRGTLLPALARVLNRPVVAILIQGLIFGAIHPTGIPAWLPLATIGATSGFLSRQTGSLVPSIVMHAVHNFGTLIFAKTVLGMF